MRDIKFRAIVDNDLNEWTYGYYLPTGNGEHYIHNSDGQLRVRPDTLGEFTGLKDRDNIEIYEGDRLSISVGNKSVYATVVFYDGAFVAESSLPGISKPNVGDLLDTTVLKVLDNIHQNKEL